MNPKSYLRLGEVMDLHKILAALKHNSGITHLQDWDRLM